MSTWISPGYWLKMKKEKEKNGRMNEQRKERKADGKKEGMEKRKKEGQEKKPNQM